MVSQYFAGADIFSIIQLSHPLVARLAAQLESFREGEREESSGCSCSSQYQP
jgi:hypothetical protein